MHSFVAAAVAKSLKQTMVPRTFFIPHFFVAHEAHFPREKWHNERWELVNARLDLCILFLRLEWSYCEAERAIAKQFSVRFSIGKISTELKKFRTLWTFVPCVFCRIIGLKNFCLILVCAFMSDFYFCIILCLILCHINFVGLNICFLFYLCLSDFLCYLCECDFLFGVIFVCLTFCVTFVSVTFCLV